MSLLKLHVCFLLCILSPACLHGALPVPLTCNMTGWMLSSVEPHFPHVLVSSVSSHLLSFFLVSVSFFFHFLFPFACFHHILSLSYRFHVITLSLPLSPLLFPSFLSSFYPFLLLLLSRFLSLFLIVSPLQILPSCLIWISWCRKSLKVCFYVPPSRGEKHTSRITVSLRWDVLHEATTSNVTTLYTQAFHVIIQWCWYGVCFC